MMPRALSSIVVLVGLVLPGVVRAAPEAVDPVEAAEDLGLTCVPVTSADGVQYTRCDGEIPSFDNVGLDTTLSIPVTGKAPLPTILMLHGWSGDKTNWLANTREGDGNFDKYHWNNVWFASRGYVAVNYTARGFKESCGQSDLESDCVYPPNRAWTHLADRRWETKDSQYILGVLVDAGIADPERLASTGGSYGGGQSWLLATSMPWDSPDGVELQLAGAVPKYPWTDLVHALTPNGRASDDLDQSRSHEEPFGVMKQSYVAALYAAGRVPGDGRYNTSDPAETHSDLDAHFLRVQAGESYDPDPVIDALVFEYRQKSAYYAEDYLDAVALEAATPHDDVLGFEEVPVFSIQGWTDPLFPAVETLQMYRKLKAADPKYPIHMAFGDIGHSNAQNPPEQWKFINRQGNQFLNTFVIGQGAGQPTTHTFSFITECPEDDNPYPPLSGTEWDRFTRGTVTLLGAAGRGTTSVGNDGSTDDPVISFPPTGIASGGCITKTDGQGEQFSATWEFPVPKRFTMVGLPELSVPYVTTGADATVAVKVWDVTPAGQKILVDRAAYRIKQAAPGPGTIDMDLFGNSWEWLPGDVIQLQIAQQDFPFLRPDNLPSEITWGEPELAIPIRQGFDLELTAP
jgi:acetyl esterase/lipase